MSCTNSSITRYLIDYVLWCATTEMANGLKGMKGADGSPNRSEESCHGGHGHDGEV